MTNIQILRQRIALIATAALGVGLLVAAPASAAASSADVQSISLATATATPTTNSVVKVNVGAVVLQEAIASATVDFTGFLTTYPVGGFAQVSTSPILGDGLTPGGNLSTAGTVATSATAGTTVTAPSGGVLRATGGTSTIFTGSPTITAASTAGSSASGFGSYSFTPTVVGLYVLTVFNDANANGVAGPGEAVQTISVTVASPTTYGYSTTKSTAFMAAGAGMGVSPDAVVILSKTPSGTQAANISVTLKNANGDPMTGESISASVVGAGTIGITASPFLYSAPSLGRALVQPMATSNVGNISVWSDGTSGVSTITISVTDATSGATTVLSTKMVTFYGPIASITPTVNSSLIAIGSPSAATNSNTAAITFVAKDSNGEVVPSGNVYANSTSATIVGSNYALVPIASGVGTYSPTGLVLGTTAITFTDGSTGALSTVTSVPSTLTVASQTPASVSIALDKATYVPGEKMTLTVTAKDAVGALLADSGSNGYTLLSSTGLLTSTSTTNTLPTGVTVQLVNGVAKYAIYAPVVAGPISINGTSGLAGKANLIASATVVAAVDAGTAANAAAVAALQVSITLLSTTVASLVASIMAQIHALSVIITKIVKKLHIK